MKIETKILICGVKLSFSSRKTLLCGVALTSLYGGLATAQSPPSIPTQEAETVVVTGVRGSIQTSIAAKRKETIISDSLTAADIGGLPATNLGDAIATIPGATTHREKGAASEIAIGGLGPFLSSVNVNGRETTTGNGKRSVNFYLFPSELINSVSVDKTQRANLIEGGTSGTISSRTARPLDSKQRKIQLSARGILTEYDKKLTEPAGLGYRFTGSYIDQFDLGRMGKFGVVFGAQTQKSNSPEELLGGGTTWNACRQDLLYSATASCTTVTPANFGTTAIPSTTPYFFNTTSKSNIQFTTADERIAYIGGLQWRLPNGIEANLDVQISDYEFNEERQIFNLTEANRGMTNIVAGADHILTSYSGSSFAEVNPTYRVQDESYRGGGFNLSVPVTDKLTLSGDVSVSRTRRERMDRSVRLRSGATTINGAPVVGALTGSNAQRVSYNFVNFPEGSQAITFNNGYDINNADNFSSTILVRRDVQIRWHENDAARIDGKWEVDAGWISQLDFGTRYSNMTYRSVEQDRRDWNLNVSTATPTLNQTVPGTYNIALSTVAAASNACRKVFPQKEYLSSDANNTIKSWASFNALCLVNSFLGTNEPGASADTRSIGNRDIEEVTKSAYAMLTFGDDNRAIPVNGNIGLRYVSTDVTSTGLRSAFNSVTNTNGTIVLTSVAGTFETLVKKYKYDHWLPSLNLSLDATDNVKVRFALSRSMTKPDPASLANGRTFTLAVDNTTNPTFTTVQQAIASIATQGNPQSDPLMSWNTDLSFEYYLNKDSMFSLRLFNKYFQGGYINNIINESYIVNGQSITVPVTVLQTTNEENSIQGFELSGTYRASSLPKPFNGLGIRGSWAYAQSDYEQEDLRLGNQTDAATGVVRAGIVSPVDIFGLSKNVVTVTPYFQISGLEVSAIYKYRSSYFQQFIGNPAQNRLVRDESTLDLNLRYNVNKNLSIQVQGTNVTDKPRYQDMPILGSFREASYYGATYFIGVTWKN